MPARVAVLFDNFGPYHIARLRAAAQRIELLAIEFANRSGVYAWHTSSTRSEPFKRVTLLPRGTSRDAFVPKFCKRLAAHLSYFRPEAVAIPGWSSRGACAALNWCLQTGTPAIVMSESSEHDEARNRWKERIKSRYVGLCSTALVGGRRQSEYLKVLGLARDRIFLGYDAVDNEYFATQVANVKRQQAEIRNKFGLPEHYFLASARFIDKKNLPRLVEAYAIYRGLARDEAWDLVLLGDGPLRLAISSQLQALGLHACVHLPGFKQYEELPVYYGSALAFVHASTTEQWGLVINEAMASGLPVLISNRCGCAPDLVREGVNGFTFDPCDVETMAQSMFKVSRMGRNRLTAMSEASCRICAEWGPERFASGLADATECALRIGPRKTSILDRLLIRTMMFR